MTPKVVVMIAALLLLGVQTEASSRRLLSTDQLTPVYTVPVVAAVAQPPATSPLVVRPAQTCIRIQDTEMPNGPLCISQLITTTTTTVAPGCISYSQSCLKTASTAKLVTPKGNALSNVQEYNASAAAACKLLGYAGAGSGSVHMAGDNEPAKQLCWNGQSWSTENWWVSLVCCK